MLGRFTGAGTPAGTPAAPSDSPRHLRPVFAPDLSPRDITRVHLTLTEITGLAPAPSDGPLRTAVLPGDDDGDTVSLLALAWHDRGLALQLRFTLRAELAPDADPAAFAPTRRASLLTSLARPAVDHLLSLLLPLLTSGLVLPPPPPRGPV